MAALLVLGIAGTALAAAEPAEELISLRWALGALDTESTAPSLVNKDTQLGAGTRLKFLVEPLSPCSVYLILLDSSDEIHVLYRESARVSETDGKTYIPPGTQWFQLDEGQGMETFFLLASVQPLADLETLLGRYDAAAPESRAAMVPTVVEEIRRLQKAHRQFARPVEKPVMIGGQTRGENGPGIDRLAMEISAERFYDKTITIDH